LPQKKIIYILPISVQTFHPHISFSKTQRKRVKSYIQLDNSIIIIAEE